MTIINNTFKAIGYGLILGLALSFYCLYIPVLLLWLTSEMLFAVHNRNFEAALSSALLMVCVLGALHALTRPANEL